MYGITMPTHPADKSGAATAPLLMHTWEKVSKLLRKGVDKSQILAIILLVHAGVAHLVERHLAKVEVASSSLVTRSM